MAMTDKEYRAYVKERFKETLDLFESTSTNEILRDSQKDWKSAQNPLHGGSSTPVEIADTPAKKLFDFKMGDDKDKAKVFEPNDVKSINKPLPVMEPATKLRSLIEKFYDDKAGEPLKEASKEPMTSATQFVGRVTGKQNADGMQEAPTKLFESNVNDVEKKYIKGLFEQIDALLEDENLELELDMDDLEGNEEGMEDADELLGDLSDEDLNDLDEIDLEIEDDTMGDSDEDDNLSEPEVDIEMGEEVEENPEESQPVQF